MTAECSRGRNFSALSSAIWQYSVDRYASHGVSLILQDGRPSPENSIDIPSSASGARRREDGSPPGRDVASERLGSRQPSRRARTAPTVNAFQSSNKIFVVLRYKKWRPKQTGGSMTRDDKGTVYCNIQMPMAKGRELSRLVAELQSSGNHPGLDSVFKEIQDELNSSIEFVEEQLRGETGFGRRLS